MNLGLLSFLASPWFVVPWYALGLGAAAWVAFDLARTNTALKRAMKWAWPIVVAFFSLPGLAVYLATARAPGVGAARADDEKERLHRAFERSMVRRVNGAVIHCVAGDGLGIMTAMVIARLLGLTFWQEFWFEYAVGFCFGWFIFQYASMRKMAGSVPRALAMAFRAEFFSMLTVMGGMGAVMTFVTPAVVGSQPKPSTAAFWGFGMLGLLAGYAFTFPMNWMIVKIGWKHGMGAKEDARPVRSRGGRVALFTAMAVLGAGALALTAWLTEVREDARVAGGPAGARAGGVDALRDGLRRSVTTAEAALARGERTTAARALDASMRAADVGATAAPDGFRAAKREVDRARHALQMNREADARAALASAGRSLARARPAPTPVPARPGRYRGVPVLDAEGNAIGEVRRVTPDRVELALGGARDVFGFWDLGRAEVVARSPDALVFGPRRRLGKSWVVLTGP